MGEALYLVFDVESVGLHGEGFAFGAVVVSRSEELLAVREACKPEDANGPRDGLEWVKAECPSLPADHTTPRSLRDSFWSLWRYWADRGAVLVADCAWPVEARFLADCVADDPSRAWDGPYPLHEVASARLAAGFDPRATVERRPAELPEHDPLSDARHSARLWVDAVR